MLANTSFYRFRIRSNVDRLTTTVYSQGAALKTRACQLALKGTNQLVSHSFSVLTKLLNTCVSWVTSPCFTSSPNTSRDTSYMVTFRIHISNQCSIEQSNVNLLLKLLQNMHRPIHRTSCGISNGFIHSEHDE